MDDTIKFRFKTRTRSKDGDYKVYSDGGRKIHAESEFKPIADKADGTDDPCAVMYEDSGKIYVAAFKLKRGKKISRTARKCLISAAYMMTGHRRGQRSGV